LNASRLERGRCVFFVFINPKGKNRLPVRVVDSSRYKEENMENKTSSPSIDGCEKQDEYYSVAYEVKDFLGYIVETIRDLILGSPKWMLRKVDHFFIFTLKRQSLTDSVAVFLLVRKDRFMSFCRKFRYKRYLLSERLSERLKAELLYNHEDCKYLSNVLVMIGAACIAVGLVHFNFIGILSGILALLLERTLDRYRKMLKNNNEIKEAEFNARAHDFELYQKYRRSLRWKRRRTGPAKKIKISRRVGRTAL
jgi:hypothetical protein